MKIRVISDPGAVGGEAGLLNALFQAGLHCLHLRKPDWAEKQLERLLDQITPLFHSRIVLHKHLELAGKYSLSGVHFTEHYRLALSRRELKTELEKWHDKGKTVSTAVHQKSFLAELPAGFDEVLVSPVFESISKEGYQPVEHWDIQGMSQQLPFKLIGLGGISLERLEEANNFGFREVAVLGTIWNEPERAAEFYQQLQEKGRLLG